ncbi:MAG TPA: L-threonylcarbamoyladenylate synthase [Planctomycetota bacterium]|nr:L-threonylcarbamoyladenylate synthase [Planctomycetota bacterium]
MTEILVVPSDAVPDDVVRRAAAALAAGGVVAAPTDTVYGLLARSGRPEAVARVYAIKGRPAEKALPFLLPDASHVETFVNRPPARARRWMNAFWPGGLTLVLGPDDRTVALRVPDHALLRAILSAAGGPVTATSANLSGRPAATRAEEVRDALGEGPDLLIDGGPARGGRESTVVRAAPDGTWKVLREGAIPVEALRRAAPDRTLFVCSGNTCRSPMAEALFRRALADRVGVPVERLAEAGFAVESAGTSAAPGDPATPAARAAAARLGGALADHRATRLDAARLDDADRVFVMTHDHLRTLRDRFPEAAGKAVLLDPRGLDVPDPFGADEDHYRLCAERLAALVRSRAADVPSP